MNFNSNDKKKGYFIWTELLHFVKWKQKAPWEVIPGNEQNLLSYLDAVRKANNTQFLPTLITALKELGVFQPGGKYKQQSCSVEALFMRAVLYNPCHCWDLVAQSSSELWQKICLETQSPELCSNVLETCAEHGCGPTKIWEWYIYFNISKQCQHQVLQTKTSANWFYFVLVCNYLSLTKKIKKEGVKIGIYWSSLSWTTRRDTETLKRWQMFSFLYRKMNVEIFFIGNQLREILFHFSR